MMKKVIYTSGSSFRQAQGRFLGLRQLVVLCLTIILLSGCVNSLSNIFSAETNTKYYEKRVLLLVDKLVNQLKTSTPVKTDNLDQMDTPCQTDNAVKTDNLDQMDNPCQTDIPDQTINRVAVMDLLDSDGRVPDLGRFLSLKIMNEISEKKHFKLIQKESLLSAIKKLNIDSGRFDVSSSKELGDVLQVEVFITGRIIDLGTNLDVNLNSVSVETGEVIASASASFARSDFAMEMLRRHQD